MANPFPGMDPYLEGDLWPSVHANLATEITRQLAPKVRPKYVVLTTQRVVLALPDEPERPQIRWPDVGVVTGVPSVDDGGATVATAPLVANALAAVPIPQYGVEIRDPVGRRLVTAIEILSPTNKHGDGRDEYAVKRQELLAGPAHLVEIDLLRVGDRFPIDRALPSVPYFVFVSRADRRPEVGIWPIPLAAPVPLIRIPLDTGDPDVPLDIQAVLTRLHDEMGYDLSVNYAAPPTGPPFSPEDAAWIDERLRAAGKRA
jgi:Protein of unknown function (DUF4058)